MAVDFKALIGTTPTREIIEIVWDLIGYTPWPEAVPFHFDVDPETGKFRRHRFTTGGEQAGKSYSASADAFPRMLFGQRYWIVGPDYAQTVNEYNYLEAWAQELGILESSNKPQKGSWEMRWISGQTITTKSAKHPSTLAGSAPDGILFVEAAQASFEAFLRCYGRTAPKQGWLLINGTFEKEDSAGWFRTLWKSWQGTNPHRGRSFNLPSWCNREFYPGGLENPEIKALRGSMTEEHFQERFGGIPSKPLGIVHPEFAHATHVRRVERRGSIAQWESAAKAGNPFEMYPDPATVVLPIDTADEVWIDPGYRHAYAALFVSIWQDTAVVYDEQYKHGWDSEKMANEALKHSRWNRVTRLIMDISGNTHAGGNRSASDIWYRTTGFRPLTRLVPILDGLERVRVSLTPHPETGQPQLLLSDTCPSTAWEFSDGYKYPTDLMGNPQPTDKPEDRNNDAVKAVVYGLTFNFGRAARERRIKVRDGSAPRPRRQRAGWELLYGHDEGD